MQKLEARRLLRLAVRTSRCGRDNPGSNPGEDTFIAALPSANECRASVVILCQTPDGHR